MDVGTLVGRPDLAGPVTARLDGTGRWGEAAKAFRGRLTVEPSTLGHIEVRGGRVAMGLADGRLRYDGTLATSAGTLALAGDGRPLDAIPTLAVRRGRADSLDLGALLARPGLSTRIDARFTAETEGTAPDSMRARLAVELLPSRINQAEIRSGRADLTLDRGALRGDVHAASDDGELLTRLTGSTAGPSGGSAPRGRSGSTTSPAGPAIPPATATSPARFTLEGAADSVGLVGLAGTITANGALDSVRLDTLQIALSPEPRVLRVDTLVRALERRGARRRRAARARGRRRRRRHAAAPGHAARSDAARGPCRRGFGLARLGPGAAHRHRARRAGASAPGRGRTGCSTPGNQVGAARHRRHCRRGHARASPAPPARSTSTAARSARS